MDIIDEANARADMFRENAVNAVRQNNPPESPLYLDGVRCCLDCEEPIPEERLEARPDAVRCVECQTMNEAHEKAKRRKM